MLEAIVLNDGGAKQQEIVKLLLDHGANPHMTDKYGKTPLELAREKASTRSQTCCWRQARSAFGQPSRLAVIEKRIVTDVHLARRRPLYLKQVKIMPTKIVIKRIRISIRFP